MWQITEYPVEYVSGKEQTLQVYKEAKVIGFGWSKGGKWHGAVVYVLETPGRPGKTPIPRESRTFYVHATGDTNVLGGLSYVGTTQDGEWHCFERRRKPPA